MVQERSFKRSIVRGRTLKSGFKENVRWEDGGPRKTREFRRGRSVDLSTRTPSKRILDKESMTNYLSFVKRRKKE